MVARSKQRGSSSGKQNEIQMEQCSEAMFRVSTLLQFYECCLKWLLSYIGCGRGRRYRLWSEHFSFMCRSPD